MSALKRNVGRYASGWFAVSLIAAALILVPICYVLFSLFREPSANWAQVKQYLLADYIAGSAILVCFTAAFAAVLGASLAWLVTGYTFPLQRFFRWALVLPLAIPPYIAAFTYRTMTSYTGIIQATLRNQFGIRVPPGSLEVMSTRGAIFVLTMCLFPYVFLITRAYLERQSASYIENAILLGRGHFSVFFRVVVPIARPALIAGVMLVVFEVLSDYGVANYFGVQTVSTAIFQTWFGMYDVDAALRLAAWLMVIVIGIFVAERFFRRHKQYHAATRSRPLTPRKLGVAGQIMATALCTLVFLVSFLIPVAQNVVWAFWTYEEIWSPAFAQMTLNSLSGAAVASAIVMMISVITARVCRDLSSSWAYGLSRLMTAGYAVPGAIIAIGVLAVFISLDDWLDPLYVRLGYEEGMLILSMSVSMLITAYVIRFMATGYNAVEAGYEKIHRSYSEASRTLGRSRSVTFFRIELPLLKGSLISGFILTLVEIIKELPLTWLLRPFNFETLSTRTYKYAIDERIYDASLPALLLIAISLVSVLLIVQPFGRKKS
jgi:iron(III) transport system permease protein